MTQLRALGCTLLCLVCLVGSVTGQDLDRIWGRVHTTSGDVHEGFLRWDRNEGSWVDVLDGTKHVPGENYLAWVAARGGERAVRTIELAGYLISWDEEDPDFPLRSASGVRFGHVASLEVTGRDAARLVLRSGEVVELSGGASDLGPGLRGLDVDVPGRDLRELAWRSLERVELGPAPAGARASTRRLYGTVESDTGARFTGYLSWDLDEILETDVLDGDEIRSRREHRVPFARIESITRIERGARVQLRDGGVLELTGSNDVDRGHRGVQISDPGLGMIEVEWRDFRSASFHEPTREAGRDAFDGGRPLRGTVVTRDGEELHGLIRWDADEGSTWELLDGRADGIAYTIELGLVERIVRGVAAGADVTLRDGRTVTLDDALDVSWDMRGILVAPEDADPTEPSSWRLVTWEDFAEAHFAHDATSADGRAGS